MGNVTFSGRNSWWLLIFDEPKLSYYFVFIDYQQFKCYLKTPERLCVPAGQVLLLANLPLEPYPLHNRQLLHAGRFPVLHPNDINACGQTADIQHSSRD